MRPIGGELEEKMSVYNHYFTDSGRSSLRLFLRYSDYREKKYLIPNFFCDVIEEVFKEEGIEYGFYNILDTLEVDVESVLTKSYDVLYLINYFGMTHALEGVDTSSKIIIEDNVFFTDFNNIRKYKFWYGFNSFRKISILSDGSLVKTNLKIDDSRMLPNEAPYAKEKSISKNIKYNYLHNELGTEFDYISRFEKAEKMLNKQKSIFSISNKALFSLFKMSHNNDLEKKRYFELKKKFCMYSFDYDINHYSFFLLKLQNRDEFRQYLMGKEIYLPIHWPETSQKNNLYDEIISVPLFAHYNDEEFRYMIEVIEEFLGE